MRIVHRLNVVAPIVLSMALAAPVARAEVEIVTGQIPPYTFEQDGVPGGVAVELVQAMAAVAGHSGKMTFLPWKRAVSTAEKGKDGPRLVIPLNRSPERESRFTWVVPLLKDSTVLVTKKGGKPRIDDCQKARDYAVGVLLGSPLEGELRAKGFTQVDVGVDEETTARKMHAGRLDAWFVASMVAPFVFGRLGFPTDELVYGASLQSNDLHLGATKSLPPEEAKKWQAALATIQANGTYERILRKYRPEHLLTHGP